MSHDLYVKLLPHVEHTIEVANYGEGENIAVECMDCCVVLVDANKDDD